MSRVLKRTTVIDSTGYNAWTCPADVNSVDVFLAGGGGCGGWGVTNLAPGGGGGGGFTRTFTNIPVTPATDYVAMVGEGGYADDTENGAQSSFGPYFAAGGRCAGRGYGILRSDDDGMTFSQNGWLGYSQVNSLAANGGYIYVGVNNQGAWRSSDHGSSWTQINNGFNGVVNINCWFFVGNKIFVGTRQGIYTSINNGASWTKDNGVTQFLEVTSFTSGEYYMYASTHGTGLYRSLDNGTSWVQANSNPNAWQPLFYQVIAGQGAILYAGAQEGILSSVDYGVNWYLMNGTSSCYTLFYDGMRSLLAGTGNGIYYSTEAGQSWIHSNLTDIKVTSVAWTGIGFLIGTESYGVFRSDQIGADWEQWQNVPSKEHIGSIVRDSSGYVVIGVWNYGKGGDGGSGGAGGAGSGGWNGNDGENGAIFGGLGQRTTTRAFGESDGQLFSGGGQGGGRPYQGGTQNSAQGGGGMGEMGGEVPEESDTAATDGEFATGGGGGGANSDAGWPGSGGSGIVIIREYYVSAANSSAGFNLLARR